MGGCPTTRSCLRSPGSSAAMRERLATGFEGVPGLTVVDGDIQKLDLPRAFDAIVSSRVLIHFDQTDVHDIVASVTRFLKPGGVFLFDVSTPWIIRYYLARVSRRTRAFP